MRIRAQLQDALDGVDGWLSLAEAEALHAAVFEAPLVDGAVRCVEIGSYKGRSAISMGIGLRNRGCPGEVVAIDPHVDDIHGEDGDARLATFNRNIHARGLDPIVRQLRMFSHDAAPLVEDGSVSVLFVDGSHAYDDVCQDIRDWMPKMADGGIVLLNDPFHRQVAWAIRDTVHRERLPLLRPRLSTNTVVLTYAPHEPSTFATRLDRMRFRAMLPVGWRLVAALHSLGSGRPQLAVVAPPAVWASRTLLRAFIRPAARAA